jgi:hypothetical protein
MEKKKRSAVPKPKKAASKGAKETFIHLEGKPLLEMIRRQANDIDAPAANIRL